jgi:hypothetical protein
LYERQKELLLRSPVLWTDDTPVTLLSSGQEGGRQGRFWACIGEKYPFSVYDFTESRARDGPAKFFEEFKAPCMPTPTAATTTTIWDRTTRSAKSSAAHARRKFFEAKDSSPRDAHQILEWIRQLYDVEERARKLSTDARRTMRAAEAVPVLDRIGARLAELEKRALPKSVLSKAVSYASNQWRALCRYTADGRLSIDNNVSERTLRHQAIGRKNWLFLGSERAGPRAASVHDLAAASDIGSSLELPPRTQPRLHGDDPRRENAR